MKRGQKITKTKTLKSRKPWLETLARKLTKELEENNYGLEWDLDSGKPNEGSITNTQRQKPK